jgi:hypothetical protein
MVHRRRAKDRGVGGLDRFQNGIINFQKVVGQLTLHRPIFTKHCGLVSAAGETDEILR